MSENKTINQIYISSFFISAVFGLFHYFIQKSDILGLYLFTIVAIPLLFLPILAIKILKTSNDERFVDILKFSSLIIFYINSAGTLFLYKYFEYDQFAHFITFLMLVIIFLSIMKKIGFEKINVFFIFFIMIMGGMLFELVQFTIDQIFNSTLFYDADQIIVIDVLTDVIADGVGIIAGLFIFKKLKIF